MGTGLHDILDFLDMGRTVAVKAFGTVTTDRMHEIWGRRRDRDLAQAPDIARLLNIGRGGPGHALQPSPEH